MPGQLTGTVGNKIRGRPRKKRCIHLSIIRVVADVPSMDIEAIYGRNLVGISSRSKKRVSLQEHAQFMVSPTCLVKCTLLSLAERTKN